jgi:hypothetical protein
MATYKIRLIIGNCQILAILRNEKFYYNTKNIFLPTYAQLAFEKYSKKEYNSNRSENKKNKNTKRTS